MRLNVNGLVGLAAVVVIGAVLIYGCISLGRAIAPPCDGGKTGPQTYKGYRIQCFHGDVVGVPRHV